MSATLKVKCVSIKIWGEKEYLFIFIFQIDVFDHDGSGAADLIGSFQTSLSQLSQVGKKEIKKSHFLTTVIFSQITVFTLFAFRA